MYNNYHLVLTLMCKSCAQSFMSIIPSHPTATLQAGYFDPYFGEENVGLREVK